MMSSQPTFVFKIPNANSIDDLFDTPSPKPKTITSISDTGLVAKCKILREERKKKQKEEESLAKQQQQYAAELEKQFLPHFQKQALQNQVELEKKLEKQNNKMMENSIQTKQSSSSSSSTTTTSTTTKKPSIYTNKPKSLKRNNSSMASTGSASSLSRSNSDVSQCAKKAKTDLRRVQTFAASSNEIFSSILNGAVFVISGIMNPERGELRKKILEMGGDYRPDWCESATHLIAAFSNTKKVDAAKADKGTIVKAAWIYEMYKRKSFIDVEPFSTFIGEKGPRKFTRLESFVEPLEVAVLTDSESTQELPSTLGSTNSTQPLPTTIDLTSIEKNDNNVNNKNNDDENDSEDTVEL